MYFSAHLSVISLILAEISSLQVDVYPQKTRVKLRNRIPCSFLLSLSTLDH